MNEPEECIVESFDNASREGWWALKVQGRAEPLIVHNNRIKELGKLVKGDKIRLQVAVHGPYGDTATYLQKLERVP